MAEATIPVIDISSWVHENNADEQAQAQRVSVAQQWHEVFSRFGCAILVGHEVSEDLFRLLDTEAEGFFNRSLAEKMQYNHGKYGHPAGGYTAPGNEKVALSSGADSLDQKQTLFDPVENFVFCGSPNMFTTVNGAHVEPFKHGSQYFQEMERVLRTIHRLSASALGIDGLSYFEGFYLESTTDKAKSNRNGNALRIAHYPSHDSPTLSDNNAGESKQYDPKIRYGAHTDYQGYTILKPDKSDWQYITDHHSGQQYLSGGLEVKDRLTGEWIPVKIPFGMNGLVVNAGDLIQRWTANVWHSPVHRVVSTGEHSSFLQNGELNLSESSFASNQPRRSLVFFTGPLHESSIVPVTTEVIKDELRMRGLDTDIVNGFPPIKAGDHLHMKLNRTN